MKIAVLEDDISQTKVISRYLESAEHTFAVFATGKDFMGAVKGSDFGLLILDWELPDMTGIDVLRWVRENMGWSIPVLFLTVRDSKEDIVTALESGADDFMTKPVDREEFIARINTLYRRIGSKEEAADEETFGNFVIHKNDRKIYLNNQSLNLTPKEYELATMLFKSEGRLLPRSEILQKVWGINTEINTRTVDTHISRLRKKLALEPDNGWQLSSIYHHGYRLEQVRN